MANRLPEISDKHKICIICEGNEEYKYLERLKSIRVWNDIYDISLVNAEGNGNIPARYQDRYQNGSYGVLCQNSVYDNMYRDPRAKRSSSNDIFIQNYIGCTYSGFDSWGDKFTIFVESVKNGIMSWKWINDIDVDDRKISISIDMKTYLDSDLCSHYEIDHREYIYEDPKAYLRYSYSGVIQLVENKVLVTYNSGQMYSYLYGGSGADGYFGTGAWRMGANLLTELQECNTILRK